MEYFVKGLKQKDPAEKKIDDEIYNAVKEVVDSECPDTVIERDRYWQGGAVDFTVVAYIPKFRAVIDKKTTADVIKSDYFERVGVAYFSEGKAERSSNDFKGIIKSQLLSAKDSVEWRKKN